MHWDMAEAGVFSVLVELAVSSTFLNVVLDLRITRVVIKMQPFSFCYRQIKMKYFRMGPEKYKLEEIPSVTLPDVGVQVGPGGAFMTAMPMTSASPGQAGTLLPKILVRFHLVIR